MAGTLTLLLGQRRHFGAPPLSPGFRRALGRADRESTPPGELHQLQRLFRVSPDGAWPSGALMEALHRPVADVMARSWLRADPVWLQADLTTARLMAWGNLGLSAEDAAVLHRSVAPLFEDLGFRLEVREPEGWSVCGPPDVAMPAFPHPLDGLGADAFGHLGTGPEARRWRDVLAEVQMVLHGHAVNLERQRRGQPPVNSLWFWGGGDWPDAIVGPSGTVVTADPELAAWARAAGCPTTDAVDATRPGVIDLRSQRHWTVIDDVAGVARAAVDGGTLDALVLDFADGHRVVFRRAQRWRIWRRRRGCGPFCPC